MWNEYSENATHLTLYDTAQTAEKSDNTTQLLPPQKTSEVGLRELLVESSLRVACPERPEKLAHKAMLQTLGWLELPPEAKPIWGETCFRPVFESSEFFKNPAEKRRKCFELRRALLKIGVVKLVHAELITTPIDTVGRVRLLTDYFDISSSRCDLNTCEILVRTISERQRESLLENMGFDPLQGTPLSRDQVQAVHDIEELALRTGRQEALRLFAELSCFANARSYMVYPRQGLGQNIAVNEQRNWAVSWLLGENSAVSESRVALADQERKNRVFGIGDSGLESETNQLECGPSFLWVLNNVRVDSDLIGMLEILITNYEKIARNETVENFEIQTKLDVTWLYNLACLLEVETTLTDRDQKLKEQRMCLEKAETYTLEEPFPKPEKFNLNHITAVVRYLRQKHTIISWVVQPEDMWLQRTRHTARSVPLSAIVSLPSWWPGVKIVAETCWLRPRNVNLQSGRSLCHDMPKNGKSNDLVWGQESAPCRRPFGNKADPAIAIQP